MTTMLVTNMQVPHVIAKANSLIHGRRKAPNRLGAMVVYPERDMAVRLGKKLIYDNFLDSVALQGDVEVRRIQATSRMIGVSIAEVAARQKYGLNIIAIEHDHHTDVEFPSQYQFRKEDIICVVGKVNNIERFERDMQDQ